MTASLQRATLAGGSLVLAAAAVGLVVAVRSHWELRGVEA